MNLRIIYILHIYVRNYMSQHTHWHINMCRIEHFIVKDNIHFTLIKIIIIANDIQIVQVLINERESGHTVFTCDDET